MATIAEENTEAKAPLSLTYNLTGIETYGGGSTEGWLHFEIKLLRGNETIIENEGTIHDIDARAIEDICLNVSRKRKQHQPLEPDFTISTEKFSEDEARLTCFVDVGNSQNKIYSGSELGVSIPTTIYALKNFGENLKAERIALTDNKKWAH